MVARRKQAISQEGHFHFLDLPVENSTAFFTCFWITWEEYKPYGIVSGWRKLDAKFVAFVRKEFMGNLNQNSGPVSGVGFATAGTAVAHPLQHGDGIHDQ